MLDMTRMRAPKPNTIITMTLAIVTRVSPIPSARDTEDDLNGTSICSALSDGSACKEETAVVGARIIETKALGPTKATV